MTLHKSSTTTRTRAAITAEIRVHWPSIIRKARRKGIIASALDALPPNTINLLGQSAKTAASTTAGVLTAVLYMAPHREAFEPHTPYTLCPYAGLCSKFCLGQHSGRMRTVTSERARLWKTALYMGARSLWRELLVAEALHHQHRALDLGLFPAVRPDGTSDTGEGRLLAQAIPGLQIYDYTKNPQKVTKPNRPKNYHLTYSYNELTPARGRHSLPALIATGTNVAAIFDTPKGDPLPSSWNGIPILDGDIHDARFLDPPGHIVGLRLKGQTYHQQDLADTALPTTPQTLGAFQCPPLPTTPTATSVQEDTL